jgi:hypothetical protein
MFFPENLPYELFTPFLYSLTEAFLTKDKDNYQEDANHHHNKV